MFCSYKVISVSCLFVDVHSVRADVTKTAYAFVIYVCHGVIVKIVSYSLHFQPRIKNKMK